MISYWGYTSGMIKELKLQKKGGKIILD